MQKKLLAVAVAGALVAPAAFAQTSVTISGALNLWYESAAATGATVGRQGDILSRDRIVDGAGSNIRFTVVEDLGSGMQAFGQVESGVLNNADTRNNAVGAGVASGTVQAAGGWATRNSGVGLRSSAWGEILLGIWDVHYNEQYAVDDHIIKGSSNSSTLGLFNTIGTQGVSTLSPTIGARYSNVIRYQSPSWGGFNFKVAYARPTDSAPTNTQTIAAPGGDITDAKKNQMWNFAPQYSNGPIFVGWSHIVDKDIVTTATPLFYSGSAVASTAGALPVFGLNTVSKITGDRLMGAYTLPMGIRIALVWDRSKLTFDNSGAAAAVAPAVNSSSLTRDAWAIPLSYTTGAHTAYATYGKAKSWKGNLGGVDVGSITVTAPAAGSTAQTVGNNTGAKMWMFGYQYALSKRTNIHLTYAKITNDSLAGYDFFSTNVGMTGAAATATQAASYGADPRVYSIGLRHAF